MDVTKHLTPELYREEYFWMSFVAIGALTLLVTRSIWIAFGAILLSALFAVFLITALPKLKKNDSNVVLSGDIPKGNEDKIVFGVTDNGTSVGLSLEEMGHAFILGISRYGKTRMVLSLISEVMKKFTKDEVLLAFSDAKDVSFTVFARSQYLFAPLAVTNEETSALIDLLLEEMYRRLALFKEYHDRICTNLDEYHDLSGEKLPKILVLFDEISDSVEPGSLAEKNLTTLAKMSLASGIHLVLITQRPTNLGISNEISSQTHTILSTYMKSSTEYGSVTKIPKVIYSKMFPRKGRFMMFSPELAPKFLAENEDYLGWAFIQNEFVENSIIERAAKENSTMNIDLPSLESAIPAWKGSVEDKIDAIEALELKLGVVTVEDMVRVFGVGRRTAKDWLKKYNDG